MSSSRYEAALALASGGFRVFPLHRALESGECSCGQSCTSPGKHPRTVHGVKDATSDPRRIDAFWSTDREANIGIATGGTILVIDLDGEQGIAEWERLQGEHGPVCSISVNTGGGGRHVYLRMPPNIDLGNSAGRIAPGIDTRGKGGYVLAPPSNHASGRCYEWDMTCPTAMVVPGWVVAALEPKRYTPSGKPTWNYSGSTKYGTAILAHGIDRIRSAAQGTRNNTLAREAFVVGQWIAGGEVGCAGILEMLVEACPDPDRKKVEVTARRQLDEGMRFPRRKERVA